MRRLLFAAVVVAAALCAPVARAASLSWVSPIEEGGSVAPGAVFDIALVRPDGDRLLPVGPVSISGGAPRLPHGELVVPVRVRAPAAGRFSVVARAGADEARLSLVVTPLDELVVKVEPAGATKVEGTTPPIEVTVAGGVAGVAPHLTVSSGKLGPLVETAPGHWRAPFHSAGTRFPEVVVITAARPWPDEGSPAFSLAHAVLPLAAAIVLPGETRPAVDVKVEIGGTSFGPVRSDASGRFEIPVVVPPGVGSATGTSVDRLGTRRVTAIDLRLPPTNRVAAAVFPTELVAGEDAEASIAVLVVDKTGGPGRDAPIVKARRGKVSELRAQGGGRFVARYTPPPTPGPDVVEVRLADRSLAEVTIAVRAGPPVALTASIAPALLPSPSLEHADITAVAHDARGALVDDAVIDVDAARGGVVAHRDGRGTSLRYVPPAVARPWTDAVRVHARGASGALAAAVALAPLESGTLGWLALDAAGRPVPRAAARLAGGGVVRADDGGFLPLAVAPGRTRLGLEGSALPAVVLVARAPDGSLVGWPSHPGVQTTTLAVDLMEPIPVDVRVARAPDGALIWRVLGGGDGERAVAVRWPGRPAQVMGRAGTLPIAADERMQPITVTDVQSGVSAVLVP